MTLELTREQLLAYQRPEPLAEDFEVVALGGTVHIEGIGKVSERRAIATEIETLREGLTKGAIKFDVDGEQVAPTQADAIAAAWAAACVRQPALTAYEWLQFGAGSPEILGAIFERCAVCSRVLGQAATETTPEVPDGIEAAKGAPSGEDPQPA